VYEGFHSNLEVIKQIFVRNMMDIQQFLFVIASRLNCPNLQIVENWAGPLQILSMSTELFTVVIFPFQLNGRQMFKFVMHDHDKNNYDWSKMDTRTNVSHILYELMKAELKKKGQWA
jgi:hypothetical protein